MADFAYGSAHNPKVDRYVPIWEIRKALRSGIGDKCDTDQYIDQYLEKEVFFSCRMRNHAKMKNDTRNCMPVLKEERKPILFESVKQVFVDMQLKVDSN